MFGIFKRKRRRTDAEARAFEIYKALVVKRVWMNNYSSDLEFYEMSKRAVENFDRMAYEDRRKGGVR